MAVYAESIGRLIGALSSLPGIGAKSAQRLAFHLISMPAGEVRELCDTILHAKETVRYCDNCCNLTDGGICEICADDSRDKSVIMVVEDTHDMAAYEKTRTFKGTYHVLHGAISPIGGVSPDDIKIKELLGRLNSSVTEVIAATNPNVEGEATAMYLCKLIKPLGITVTRIANGVPMGADLEYIDQVTLTRALEGRREMV